MKSKIINNLKVNFQFFNFRLNEKKNTRFEIIFELSARFKLNKYRGIKKNRLELGGEI